MEVMESGLGVEARAVAGAGDAVQVTLHGPIDARSVLSLKTAVAGFQGKGIRRFILDMSDVKFVNSTGISFLINLSESLGEGKQAVTLVGVQPKVKIIFDTMSVSDFFKSAPSVEAAAKQLTPVRAVAKPPPSKATTVRREGSSTKTGRVSPPTVVPPPPSKNPLLRFFRRLFGGR
jgi:stage II sporulation protein AA (anti-sigma F factor antagonist)